MTKFELIKDKIWNAAQKQNREKFDKECTNLMKKAVNDWWRIGWSIYPKSIDEIIKGFERVAKKAHKLWIKAMKSGDAPSEDVSPGEGFALCAQLIRELKSKKFSKKSSKLS